MTTIICRSNMEAVGPMTNVKVCTRLHVDTARKAALLNSVLCCDLSVHVVSFRRMCSAPPSGRTLERRYTYADIHIYIIRPTCIRRAEVLPWVSRGRSSCYFGMNHFVNLSCFYGTTRKYE